MDQMTGHERERELNEHHTVLALIYPPKYMCVGRYTFSVTLQTSLLCQRLASFRLHIDYWDNNIRTKGFQVIAVLKKMLTGQLPFVYIYSEDAPKW